MRDDRELREGLRDGPGNIRNEWPEAFQLAPVPRPEPTRSARYLRRGLTGATALLVLATVLGTLWLRSSSAGARMTGGNGLWNIELASGGARPVTALVFGQEAGVHLVRIPATGTAPDARRRIPVRLAQGDVYMMSLGGDGLDVWAANPPGSPPMAFAAHARFVKLVNSPTATGIRTGWW